MRSKESLHVQHPLYNIAQIRAIEAQAFEQMPSFTLMERAGQAIADWLSTRLPATGQCIFLAGPGNNGGDASVAAALLCPQHPQRIALWLLGDPQHLPPDAQQAWKKAQAAGVSCTLIRTVADLSKQMDTPAWIIDGLFGIGLQRAIKGVAAQLVHWTAAQRAAGAKVVALDVPSGLHADTGQVVANQGDGATQACALVADATITMLADKPGLHTGAGRDYAGQVYIADLGLSTTAWPAPYLQLLQPADFTPALPQRHHASHKGSHGNVGVIGGAAGMVGAPLLAARAALHSGAGRVFVGFVSPDFPSIDVYQAELMLHAAEDLALDTLDTILIGTGLGQAEAALFWLKRVLALPCPCVLDADALNLLAQSPDCMALLKQRAPYSTVLTPHPLEAARLLGCTAQQVQQDRLAASAQLQSVTSATVVLKGSGTIIQTDVRAAINPTGNAGLASAGTGDVLAGTIAALLAQGLTPHLAACTAVYCHGQAADDLVAQGIGPIGLTAGELPVAIRAVFNVAIC